MKLFIKNKNFRLISAFALKTILMLDEKNDWDERESEREKRKKNLHIMPQIYGAAFCHFVLFWLKFPFFLFKVCP